MSKLGHISHPRMPLASCPNSFTPASSPARFLSHYPLGQQRNSCPKAFTSIKGSSAIQISPLLLLKTTFQHHFPTKLKNKPLIYNFSKSCWLKHTNSCLHLPPPNNIRLWPVPSCSHTGTTLHPVSWISPPASLSCALSQGEVNTTACLSVPALAVIPTWRLLA